MPADSPLSKDGGITRRGFLKGILGVGLGSAVVSILGWNFFKRPIPGSIHGALHGLGHLVRQRNTDIKITETQRTQVVIVGGGISGLTAGWWLSKNKLSDFKLLELSNDIGGNSVGGANSTSAYPWGAHYVPLPNKRCTDAIEVLEEMGLVKFENDKVIVIDESAQCFDPRERLFKHGKWLDSVGPQLGLSADSDRVLNEFGNFVEKMKSAKGSDGKYGFDIPVENSSRDAAFLMLDKISFKEFLISKEWADPELLWYVDYCCRDDFGLSIEKVSAWAGIHYFCSRHKETSGPSDEPILTWPEGNFKIAKFLSGKISAQIQKQCVVTNVKNHKGRCLTTYFQNSTQTWHQIESEKVIYAAPRYTAKYLIEDYVSPSSVPGYTPWIVANITLKATRELDISNFAWDNVWRDSDSLGFIHAKHQSLRTQVSETVVTYYLPCDRKPEKLSRVNLLKMSHAELCEIVVADLQIAYPTIRDSLVQMDFWIWGHGMPGPGIGFLWSGQREVLHKPYGNIHFAHSELSGISIFEEAQYWGKRAAESVLKS
jgi:protoporphyrinogen oxidase